ncbi:hypothetical protein, partial [Pseudomonas aeruginosa]|uniref:hypothetical protein n=1 Tax=Pseudomonas aeruginosa TaxID=287 RepID=UPI001BD3A3CE
MRPLSDIATTLFLAIAVRYVTNEPTLADAAAIIAGRTRKWSTWGSLTEAQQTLIVSERASHLAGGYPVVRQQLGQGAGL